MDSEQTSSKDTAKAIIDNEDNVSRTKRVKTSNHEEIYAKNLPSCEAYERSYMHRDNVTHVSITKSQFLVTASQDGVVKFWKKTTQGIEFVKSFKSHTGPVEDMSITPNGGRLATISLKDKTIKIFDIINFDMINMISLKFAPKCVEWINQSTINHENLLISDSKSNSIYTFDSSQATNEPKNKVDNIHSTTVCRMRHNWINDIVVSVDIEGLFKYWRAKDCKYDRIKHPNATDEYDTVIHDFITKADSKKKVLVHNISFSPDGNLMATTSSDRKVRLYKFKSGKLAHQYDESIQNLESIHKSEPLMNNMDFSRRIAIEREMEKNNLTIYENVIFDQSGLFVMFPTMLGVKVWNWKMNRLIKTFGREETNFRPLCISLFQGLIYNQVVRRFNFESLDSGISDPTLFCSSYRKNRFYCFSNRHFEEEVIEGTGGDIIRDRDIYNEKPTREEIMAAIEIEQSQKDIYDNATIYTTMGDIHLKLFPQFAPKACENFSVHAKNGYYNNHIFHRVIGQFMIQTGDPTGTGTGGESIWDSEFQDEFCDDLKHDKPFMLSMANCGPNTNGSQFFITVAPCTFLDKKHTIFGQVLKGMDVCISISKVKTDPSTDKPYDDIKIINISVY